jgi:competence ComEA-like helix-hairpin-helix protein
MYILKGNPAIMLPEKLKAYFSFTKKERTGVLVLILLIIIIFILPYLFPSSGNKTDEQAFRQFQSEIARLSPKYDSASLTKKNDDDDIDERKEAPGKDNSSMQGPLFYFDPNSISGADWKQLGLRDKTIHTIANYLARGGRFKNPDDLAKIYGLQESEFRRLLPYVRIKFEKPFAAGTGNSFFEKQNGKAFTDSFRHKKNDPEPVDINTADTTALIALHGIGSKLANRIVNFRQKLGGFYSVEQLAETYGLADSIFRQIKPFLKITYDSLKQIDINTADLNMLKQHPYIRWNIANAIVQYRRQHGAFKSLAELQQIAAMDTSVLRKVSPYLKIN